MADETKLVFDKLQTEGHIGHQTVSLALKVGLISQAKAPGRFLQQCVSINFYHKSIQEFMAALHLACGTSADISSFCRHLPSASKIMEQATMIRFVIGLDPTGGIKISKHVASITNKDDRIKFYRSRLPLFYEEVKATYRAQCQWYREITHGLEVTSGSLSF